MELSRQLADFLEKPLQQSGGIMTLPDVYCLYNRARGTELVSPDDLLQAIKQFSQVSVVGCVILRVLRHCYCAEFSGSTKYADEGQGPE